MPGPPDSSATAASQELALSEKRFRDLVEGAPDGVVILRGPTVVFMNARAAALLGLASAELGVGRTIVEFLHPDDRERAAQRIRQLLKDGRLEDSSEYRSLDERGAERIVEISSILIDYAGGPAVLAFARDVTARKRMEVKLLEADRLTALGVLSAGVAHEINNPLAYVLLNLEYLKRELPKAAADPTLIESLLVRVRDACHGAERVAAIVRDLRTFARGEETARQPVSLETVIEAAVNIAHPEIRTRARLERRYQTVPAIDGSAGRLEQVFLNLLLNAAQAFPDGSDPSENVIRVSLRSEGDDVIAEVGDNGPGIPAALVGRIFDPFFTTKPVGVGTGLGLPICRGIVHTHGGEITVSTSGHAGTVFSVKFPVSSLSPTLPRHVERGPAEAGPTPERGRVLIVDDERVVAHTLKLLLQNEHELTVVQSGPEALEVLRRQVGTALGYDAVVCDLMMPGMTGMELFAVLRRERPSLAERVVFMTGGVSMQRVAEFLDSVPNSRFEKPFDIAELRGTLRRLVAEARAESRVGC